MSQKVSLLSLGITILFVNIFAYQEDEYYCRNHAEYQICRRCIDPDNNCNVAGKGCFCDNIAVYHDGREDFVGGANCETETKGEPFCYVNAASNCEDKEYSELASSYESLWYPKVDGYTEIYASKEACYEENFKGNDTGNEEILEGIKINSDFLVSPEGNKLDFTFDLPEYKEGADYDDYDYDEEPGYIKCQKQCLGRNIESNMCGAWSYDALNGKCYLHNVDACCGQLDKQVADAGFISGYSCPHCWSTRNSYSESEWCGVDSTPCDLRLRQTCATCTIHNSGAGTPDLTSPAGLLRVDTADLNLDLCQCERKYMARRRRWICRKPCCKEGGCQDSRRCRRCKKRRG